MNEKSDVTPIPVNAPVCKHGKMFLEYCPHCESAARWNKDIQDAAPVPAPQAQGE